MSGGAKADVLLMADDGRVSSSSKTADVIISIVQNDISP